MYNIKVLNKISQIGLDKFDNSKYNVAEDAPQPDGILVRSAKMHDMVLDENVKCIARAGIGVNNIPVEDCSHKGIVVFNTPGANAEAVKELVLCALLISSRDVIGGVNWVKENADNCEDLPSLVEKGKNAYVGPEIMGKSLGVIGLGAIGAKIANDALALGMKVYGYDPYLSVDAAWNLSSSVIHATDVETIYKNCDYITIHIPFLDSTYHFIDREAFAKMRTGVRLINLARGELVNDDALVEAIDCGKVACYVTDFPNKNVVNLPNVIAIPHLGASTPESEDNCAVMAVKELTDYLENGNITNSVNMPRAVMPRTGDMRICVIHKNIPDMLASITKIMSGKGVNIENMLNAGRKGNPYAYTMIDLEKVPEGLEEEVYKIEGVIRVRVLH